MHPDDDMPDTPDTSLSSDSLPPISPAELEKDIAAALDTIAPLLIERVLGANPVFAIAFRLVWPLIRLEISRIGAQEMIKTVSHHSPDGQV